MTDRWADGQTSCHGIVRAMHMYYMVKTVGVAIWKKFNGTQPENQTSVTYMYTISSAGLQDSCGDKDKKKRQNSYHQTRAVKRWMLPYRPMNARYLPSGDTSNRFMPHPSRPNKDHQHHSASSKLINIIHKQNYSSTPPAENGRNTRQLNTLHTAGYYQYDQYDHVTQSVISAACNNVNLAYSPA